MTSLRSGMSRRAFVFISNDEKAKKLDYIIPFEQRELYFDKAKQVQSRIKKIYDTITPNTTYLLSEESKKMLVDYQNSCIDYFNNSKDNMIVKLEKLNSFWKITKLAVIYSVIDNPKSIIVSSEYVQMAIDFYNLISPCLKNVIEKRKKSEIELYAEYINDNKDEIITRTALRNLNLVNGNKFKKFWEEHEEEIKDELRENYKLELYDYAQSGNSKSYQCVKLKS